MRNLKGLTLAEAQRVVSRCVLDDDILDAKDIEAALERKKQHIEKSGLLECVGLGEEETHLGGLASLKGWLRRYSAGFSDQARKLGLRPPRGVLFVGVQGCGKSLAAKTIARQWHLPLVRLDPSQILNKYVGESEKNLRHVFEIVESVAPVVLWIDEIEKAFSNASGNDGDGGLGRRIFGSFLTWMQEKKDGVFVTATANEWAKLPPEFQRKGRFDEVFFIDLPNDKERLDILRIHLQKRNLPIKGIDLARLVRESAGFSGAEIEQVVIASLYSVLEANGKSVTTDQILEEIRKTVPLSRSRKEQVDALRSFAQDRFVSAS